MTVNFHGDALRGNMISDALVIRGQGLAVDGLIAADIDDPAYVAAQAKAYREGNPFPHVVIDGLFNAELLRLVEEEFALRQVGMRTVQGKRELTTRSKLGEELGIAAQAYVNVVHSNRFVRFVSAVTGIEDLIVDHSLRGGGLHETPNGGFFGIHRDFNLHHENMLANRLVMITYLNQDWLPDYGGALELWDAGTRQCATAVQPLFGSTILMSHSKVSFHGHPTPLTAPEGRTRKSIAVYFYENAHAKYQRGSFHSSLFLSDIKGSALPQPGKPDPRRRLSRRRRVKALVRDVVPPFIWFAARRLRRQRKRVKGG